MRISGIVAGGVAVLIVIAVLGTELAATSVATRAVRDAVERCAEVDEVEVTSIGRPAVVGLLTGSVRDLRIRLDGVRAGDLRIAQVDARIPEAPAGLGSGPETVRVVAELRVEEADLERYLAASAPDLASPTLAITPDGLEIGDERVPFTLGAQVTIAEDGDLRLVPTLGDPRLWSSLGLELDLDVPDAVQLTGLELRDGDLVLAGFVEVTADVGGDLSCPDVALLGTAAPAPALHGGRG